ncbi:MAG: Hint domain-containing protein [Pseudotabrizicola sp.]|uniref:Hint domain-containing protein n=1 Tax=Pseudotabrizicola sp. TaxID=2939647 RepID=UPI00272FF416|nr:Hint domain-containing protein [Pseudotabrizicola sp.]MDP2082989.1 Hint domain-containing protein [Pseudotabrizicola sp.]MDZ7574521.1 Hint domain-containing protein [Pseudotabrizicola sp.]
MIEVTGISADTTYSTANGKLLGVLDNAQLLDKGVDDKDGEFDIGDSLLIDGVSYTIDRIQKPSSSGRFILGDGSDLSFSPASESNLQVIFLTVSSGGTVRHFIIPNDSYGDMSIEAIRTGSLTDVAGNDAGVISTSNNTIKIVCFTRGTMIEVARNGLVAIENLLVDDWVKTVDHGIMQIRWIGCTVLDRHLLEAFPNLRPIRIRKGALGLGTPEQDLCLSPQHRILVKSKIAQRMFGEKEVLVAVKHLVGLRGIEVAQDVGHAEYHHILLDSHEILLANGAACESLYPGREALKAVGSGVLEQVVARRVQTDLATYDFPACRHMVSGRQGHALVARHKANRCVLFEDDETHATA